MSSHTMDHKNGRCARIFRNVCSWFWGISLDVFNKMIIPLALVGFEVVIANSEIRVSLAIYHNNFLIIDVLSLGTVIGSPERHLVDWSVCLGFYWASSWSRVSILPWQRCWPRGSWTKKLPYMERRCVRFVWELSLFSGLLSDQELSALY